MNKFKALLLAVVVVGAPLAAADADAQRRHGHGHRHHHHRGSVGIFFGAPLFYAPYYYYPRSYYYPPGVYYGAPASPPVYVEQSGVPVAPVQNSSAYWYFCRDTQTYYPYVQQCASPWERVTPQSAPPA